MQSTNAMDHTGQKTLEYLLLFGLMRALTHPYTLTESWFPELPQRSKSDYWASAQSLPLSRRGASQDIILDLHLQGSREYLPIPGDSLSATVCARTW